jgi:hypothetical protein
MKKIVRGDIAQRNNRVLGPYQILRATFCGSYKSAKNFMLLIQISGIFKYSDSKRNKI